MNRDHRKMRFLALSLISLLLLPLNMWAQSIDEAEARQRAQHFMSQRYGGKPKALRTAHRGRRAKGRQTTTACDYYIFNAETGGGFVIVSGDERTISILGYSDSGSIQEGTIPEGLKVLLEDYSEQIAGLEEYDVQTSNVRRAAPVHKTIPPLIETKWNQDAPYNNDCPEISGSKAVTGCVATAMAQIMYYHQWPEDHCYPIPGYTTTTAKLALPGLDATSFNWGAMDKTYSSEATGAAADAVAQLMKYCCWAVQMDYGVGLSSAYSTSSAYALKTLFSYDRGINYVRRINYTYTEWVELLYSELASSRPVLMGGQSAGGGHAFVCDGYDTDDYFHINWGWGGSSDGYFRLAVLQPYSQGVGGSSTLDGFSFAQGAIVGIQKPTQGTKDYCLSLEDFYLNDFPTSNSHTFNRASANDAFTDINLDFILCSYFFDTNAFDIEVQLVDECDNCVTTMYDVAQQSMKFNTNLKGPYSCSIPSSVPDGTYYIKMMSRPHTVNNDTPWMECYAGIQYMMTAVISGNELNINVPQPNKPMPANSSIIVEGNKTLGFEQNVTASITGGSGDYHNSLFLYVNDVLMMGKDVEIPAGTTVDVHFSFIPTTVGDNTIKITTSRSTNTKYVIGEGTTVTILDSDASNTQELTIEPTITNLTAGGKLYGNAVRATVRLMNTSTTNSYIGHVSCSLRMYDNATDAADKYFDAKVITKSVVIPKSESAENLSYIDLNFDYNGLDPSKCYRLRFSYLNSNANYKTASGPIYPNESANALEMGEGYALYSSDGSVVIKEINSAIDAGSFAFADLSGINSFDGITITPSLNPNCIYLLATDVETPDAISSCNVVSGTSVNNLTSSTLTLQDGYDFFTPVPFTATAVSYTRTFTLAANGTSGWNTILLPFDVSSVSCAEIGTVDWFHSGSDTGKNFWVRTFTADGPGTVIFDYAEEMAAYTPYIIAVPDDRWGSDWQMTDRAVTFSGTNAHIEPTNDNSVGGNDFRFCGCTISKSLNDVYLLNNDGSSFVLIDTPTDISAFRAWFYPVELSSLTSPALSIGSPTTTGIGLTPTPSPMRKESKGMWFDISGRKLYGAPTNPGLYINKGKKIVIQ